MFSELVAAHNFSAGIDEEGILHVWGGEGRHNEPTQVDDFGRIQFSKLCPASKQLLTVVGLTNLPTIQFSSFNPPEVKAGSFSSLLDWLISPKRCSSPHFSFHGFFSHPKNCS